MDVAYFKGLEPLFGAWTVTGYLGRAGLGQLFALESGSGPARRTAALKCVFLPGRREDIRQLMRQSGASGDEAAFLRDLAQAVNGEIAALAALKGKPGIPVCAEHCFRQRGDRSGVDVLLRTEPLVPLPAYQKQHPFSEREAVALGIDLCDALEACRQAGIVPAAVSAERIFVTPSGAGRFWGFEDRPAAAIARAETEDVFALGQVLQSLVQALPALDPRFAALLYRARSADPARRFAAVGELRRQLALLAQAPAEAVPPAAPPQPKAPGPAAVPQHPAAVPPPEEKDVLAFEAAVQDLYDAPAAPAAAAKGRRAVIAAAVLAGAVLFAAAAYKFVLPRLGAAPKSPPGDTLPADDTPDTEPTPTPLPEPTLSPEQVQAAARDERIRQVLETVQDNCTGTAPQITDPAGWAEAGKALMDRLEADPYYQEWGFSASAAAYAAGGDGQNRRGDIAAAIGQWQDAAAVALPEQYPYLLAVNRAASTVTVFTADETGRYTVPYMAMVCSGGPDTPTGFWFTPISYQWRTLVGPCYGQNATRIWDSYLFHSVPYYSQHKDDVEYDEYNLLGTQASLGCIRLAMADVKWIFDNCPLGTPVVIYDDENDPGPMGKPGTIYIGPDDETMRGWDPTDPDPANPWDPHYRSGTAIRSEAAWEEYKAAAADGRWSGTINPADLQGWSTDSAVAGTRG